MPTEYMWPFLPNWVKSVSVTDSFRTDIYTSRSGREQRRALRSTPRKSVEFETLLYGDLLRRFDRAMARWQDQTVVMGDPTRSVRLVTGAASGATVLRVEALPYWLAVGERLVLQDGEDLRLATVSAIAEVPKEITLTAALTASVGIDARLRPALKGTLAPTLRAQFPTNAAATVDVQFDVDPGSETAWVNDPGYDLLSGREVLAKKFNWANGMSVEHAWSAEQVDFGFGRIANFHPVKFGTATRQAVFVGMGQDDVHDLESFWLRAKGQRGEFYMPSGTGDMTLAATAATGSDVLVIEGTETYDDYADDAVYKAIALIFTDGRRVYRDVVDISVAGSTSLIQVERPFLTDVAPADLFRISWMTVSRFASDQFTQEWLTTQVAQTQLAIRTLENLPTEAPVATIDGAAQWILEVWGDIGADMMDRLNIFTNIDYPAVFFSELGWSNTYFSAPGRDGLDWLVNYRYPEVMHV